MRFWSRDCRQLWEGLDRADNTLEKGKLWASHAATNIQHDNKIYGSTIKKVGIIKKSWCLNAHKNCKWWRLWWWWWQKPLKASSSMLDSTDDDEKCSGVVTWRWWKENQKKNRDEGVISCSLRKWVSKGRWWFHPWVWRLWSSENGCLMTFSHFFNEEFKKTPPSLVVGVVASFYTDIRSH